MAVLYISEYHQLAIAGGAVVAAGVEPALVEQIVAVGAGSAVSAPFSGATRFVRVHTDSICSIAFGAAPTALTAMKRLAAGQTEFFGVQPGHSVAVIANV